MIEIPLARYVEITGQSRQALHEKVKNGKLKTRKDESTGRVYVILDIDPKEIGISKDEQDDIKRIESIMGSLILEYKNDLLVYKEELKSYTEKINAVNQERIKALEESNKKILEMKDEQIKKLENEVKELRKGFFRKLFG